MKVNEFVNKIENNKTTINSAFVAKMLNTKEYLAFKDKVNIAMQVTEDCKIEQDGYVCIDKVLQYIYFTKYMIEAYTDLEFSNVLEEMEQEYDILCKNNLLNMILSTFESEYKVVMNLMQMECDLVYEQNKTEAHVAKVLNKVGSIIDAFSEVVLEKINSVDFNNLDTSKINDYKISDIMKLIK